MKVRNVLERLKADGWVLVSQRGSHRQFKHPSRPGKVTVAGGRNVDLAMDTLTNIRKQAGWK
ncbi:MAG: type II toxin-antitoxin system HicA family toxin [Candidatus Eremiobacteraeota bacterium]|nr:type II toxin-antitoxin system HicA family toxin [Candidatus Eremiobacteraeota bacterium]